jgi:translation elongation factor EF-1alpha
MNKMSLLEEKIEKLVSFIQKIQSEKMVLETENRELKKNITALETIVMQESKSAEALHEEKEMTKLVVDNLIKSIDSLVGSEK